MKDIINKILKLIPNAIKKFLYGDIRDDISVLNDELKDIKKDFNSSEKDELRYEILSFASSLRRGEEHTTQEFETIFHFHDKYEELLLKLKEKNGFTTSEFEYIKKKYNEKMEENIC